MGEDSLAGSVSGRLRVSGVFGERKTFWVMTLPRSQTIRMKKSDFSVTDCFRNDSRQDLRLESIRKMVTGMEINAVRGPGSSHPQDLICKS